METRTSIELELADKREGIALDRDHIRLLERVRVVLRSSSASSIRRHGGETGDGIAIAYDGTILPRLTAEPWIYSMDGRHCATKKEAIERVGWEIEEVLDFIEKKEKQVERLVRERNLQFLHQ